MKRYLVKSFFAFDIYWESYDKCYSVVDESYLMNHGFRGDVGILYIEPTDEDDHGGLTYRWVPINEDGTISLSHIEHLEGVEIDSEIPYLEYIKEERNG